jgi:hypothetical protein
MQRWGGGRAMYRQKKSASSTDIGKVVSLFLLEWSVLLQIAVP